MSASACDSSLGNTYVGTASGGSSAASRGSDRTGGASSSVGDGSNSGSSTDITASDLGPFAVDNNGYVTSGSWHGYQWTATDSLGSNISVDNGSELRVSGKVVKDSKWAGYATFGWNVAQERGDSPVGSVRPDGDGITVTVSNATELGLRVQLDGDGVQWCANLEDGGGFVAYSDFKTECWSTASGESYAGEEFSAIAIVVPGKDQEDRSFDYAVFDMTEHGGSAAGGGTRNTDDSSSNVTGNGGSTSRGGSSGIQPQGGTTPSSSTSAGDGYYLGPKVDEPSITGYHQYIIAVRKGLPVRMCEYWHSDLTGYKCSEVRYSDLKVSGSTMTPTGGTKVVSDINCMFFSEWTASATWKLTGNTFYLAGQALTKGDPGKTELRLCGFN